MSINLNPDGAQTQPQLNLLTANVNDLKVLYEKQLKNLKKDFENKEK